MIVCIDGPNGVGKTTFAKNLQEQNKSFILLDDELLNKFLVNNDYLEARKMFQNYYKIEKSNKNFILVRWLPSMYVFDYYQNDIEFLRYSHQLIRPNETIILFEKKGVILKRIKKRKNFKCNISIDEQIKRFEYYAQKFRVRRVNSSEECINFY